MRPIFAAAFACLALVAPAQAATLEEMAGQMIVIGFDGKSAEDPGVKAMAGELAAGRLGGVMYLKKNVASLAAVAKMNAEFRAASPDLPPFITLDQEGGAVERLTKDVGFTEIPNAATIAADNSPEAAEAIYAEMAKGIAAQGFTVNFGPVADLNINPNNQVIAKFGRAYSADPETVTAYDRAFIEGHHKAGLATALKHFPGHGSSTADSHEGFVDITKTWSEDELEPYRELIGEGVVDMVMVGHLYHADYADDDGQTPSSLSARWIDGVLRTDLGFDGVVISDDLEMGAIRDHFTLEQTVVEGVKAGMDILLFSNTGYQRPGLSKEVLAILMEHAEKDPAFAKRIEQSYERIVALKRRLG
ncbi:glycoside hydrolase family 3 N-terminal domain-containing protein [Devosia sp.]|uniref:glycoside hydrolase family 3 protein n=1 Tax=Devosia sp. TaxID=1871048 RepID=UPI001AD53741|nr:glycoside hydrolase family 3 N-terminal domain-containing protein [Devosia sp.]MBN9335324.1 glycoside hydrolase family 3 protein [Devosia sp.]